MNTVFIVPTGIGATIGGDAGDATPAFKLIAAVSDVAITHPNVVNASDINEMPDNTWYVEGSILDRFLEGEIELTRPRMNKILVVANPPISNYTVNAVSAARVTIGIKAEILELEKPLRMVATTKDGRASGEVYNWVELVRQVKGYEFDALALHTPVEVPQEVAINYLRNGGINPWGGVEAIASKLVANKLNKPIAHAPLQCSEDSEIAQTINERIDPRIAPEIISNCYLHSVLKGLHRAPRIGKGLSCDAVDVMVSPKGCVGRPHMACLAKGIPIIVVEENSTCLNEKVPKNAIIVSNYWEATGVVMCMKAGVDIWSVRRPLEYTKVIYNSMKRTYALK